MCLKLEPFFEIESPNNSYAIFYKMENYLDVLSYDLLEFLS